MTQPVIRKPGEGRIIAVVGDVYRFLATGDDRSLAHPGLINSFSSVTPER